MSPARQAMDVAPRVTPRGRSATVGIDSIRHRHPRPATPSDSSRDRLAAALGRDAEHVVMERGFSLAFVGVHGQVRLVQFRLSKKGFDATTRWTPRVCKLLGEFATVVDRLLALVKEGETVDARQLPIRAWARLA